jgi:hypothetical protein
MVQKQDVTNAEIKSMKKEIHKLNVGMAENTRAIIKLADNLEEMSDHDKRIKALVF